MEKPPYDSDGTSEMVSSYGLKLTPLASTLEYSASTSSVEHLWSRWKCDGQQCHRLRGRNVNRSGNGREAIRAEKAVLGYVD